MQDLLADLIDSARARAGYADARFVRSRVERLSTRNGTLDQLDSGESEGIGVRVRVGGAWGFAAVRGTDRRDAEAALARALAIAEAQPAVPEATPLAPEPPAQGEWANPVARDPFEVPIEEKLAILLAADAGLRTEPGVNLTLAHFSAFQTDKIFASTEGALCEQRITECGGGIAAVAVDGRQPDPLVPRVARRPRGAGRIRALPRLELPGHAPRVASEAVALLRAPACPPGRKTLILAGEQLGLQVHESVGHAVELDRVLGREASYAGTSFVPADGIGSLRFGSEHVSVTADATNPGGLGSFRWDDEGVEGRPVPIVRDGVLAGFLSSRETAAEIGLERSGGCMRAEGFDRQPIVRMTNVNLEPGDGRQPRGPDRGHGRRPADRDQPLVVDRQPPPALPVRGRGGLGDHGRRARPPAAQPELRRRNAGVLGQLRRRLLAARVAADLPARLRQGRARPGDAGVPRHRARPLSRRAGWRGVNTARGRGARRRTRGAGALALVTHERSLMLRFAASRPTQSTGIDDVTVEIAVPLRGNVGRAVDQCGGRRVARRLRRSRAACGRGGRGDPRRQLPGLRPQLRARQLKAFDLATAELDPATGGAALADAFAEAEAHGRRGARDLDRRRAGPGMGDRRTRAARSAERMRS